MGVCTFGEESGGGEVAVRGWIPTVNGVFCLEEAGVLAFAPERSFGEGGANRSILIFCAERKAAAPDIPVSPRPAPDMSR